MKYAIKKGDKYYTENGGWTKNLYKAELISKQTTDWYLVTYPVFFKNCKPVPIKETYTREEVKE